MSLIALRERRDLCRELLRLADQQHHWLAERNYDALIELLAEKRSLLDRLAVSAPTVRDWVSDRDALSRVDRAEGEMLHAEAKKLMAETAVVEERAVAELTSQRNSTQRELNEIASSGQVNVAYRDALAPATHRSLNVAQ